MAVKEAKVEERSKYRMTNIKKKKKTRENKDEIPRKRNVVSYKGWTWTCISMNSR